MDTIFMNSENSKTSEPHRLLLNLSDKINLQGSDKNVASSNLSIYYTWKNIKESYKKKNYKLQREMINLNYLMDYILCQMFKIFLSISSKNMKQ